MLDIQDLQTSLFGPISLNVGAGECVAIMGASGSGKSLFLRAIVDLDPSEGAVRLNDVERASVQAQEWRRRVAYVPAETGWWAESVSAHFPSGPELAPLLEAVGLADAAAWNVDRLSSGERQRLGLVRALLGAPSVLLLDEPTAALDATATEQVEALIRARYAAGVPVVLVTHDRSQADRLAERRYRMAGGKLETMEALSA